MLIDEALPEIKITVCWLNNNFDGAQMFFRQFDG
jgi:hypothetical protein